MNMYNSYKKIDDYVIIFLNFNLKHEGRNASTRSDVWVILAEAINVNHCSAGT